MIIMEILPSIESSPLGIRLILIYSFFTMPFFKITLTAAGGLSAKNVQELVKYFTKKCKHAYIVNEFGESGANSHMEGIIEFPGKRTDNVTRAISTQYKRLGIDVVARITINVKSVFSLQGCLSYASKELKNNGKVVLLLGWEESWIQTKVGNVSRNISPTTLLSMGTWVNKRIGPAQIYKWCQTNNRRIRNLREYREVCVSMGDNQYMFDRGIHKCTYANVMALFKDGCGVGEIIDDECRFLML